MMFDLHCDTVMRLYQEKGDLLSNDYHIDLNKMKAGKANTQFFAMFVDLKEDKEPFKVCNEMLDCFEKEVAKNKSLIQHVKDFREMDDRISGIMTIEEGGVLEGNIEHLEHFYNRGVRAITLTWNYKNEIGYPNYQYTYQNKGLTPFGIEVVREMNRLGMLIDVSHLSDQGFWDCIKHSTKPIIASHSNARSVCDHSRNLTDDMILALRDNGGVMGMNFCSAFLNGSRYSSIDAIVEHIKYIDELAGIDVIAIGTDFDGIGGELEIYDISQMDLLRQALRAAGYDQESIDKIFYKNAMRVFKALS